MGLCAANVRNAAVVATACLCVAAALAQVRERKWARYEDEMQDPVGDPSDADRPGEFAFARLRYRSPLDRAFRGGYARWGIDCNKGDRLFIQCLRRLTRIDMQSVETIIDIDSDEVFNWPWLFAVSAGDWNLSPPHAERLRKYLDRGGFLMVDDFHNEREWAIFMEGIRRIYPDAMAEELEDGDPIFSVIYTMRNRRRVPGANVVHGSGIERGGVEPHWRAVRDSRGRVMVAICFNMDVGDGWEFADDPEYPAELSAEAIHLGVNYVGYAMTH